MFKILNTFLVLGVLLLFSATAPPATYAVKYMQYTGYQVLGPYTTLRVEGSWVVPKVNCTKTPNSVSNISVIIDGISGEGDAMMIGTYQNCVNGVAHYGAFLNVYPYTKFYANATSINRLLIHPGDRIEAQGTWRYPAKPIDWNTNFVDLTTKVTLDTDAYTPSGFKPVENSGAIILSSDGHTLTALSLIGSGKRYTYDTCSDVSGPELICHSFGTTANITGYTLIKWRIPGIFLSALRDNGSSFRISGA